MYVVVIIIIIIIIISPANRIGNFDASRALPSNRD